jgi:hypothetical protein
MKIKFGRLKTLDIKILNKEKCLKTARVVKILIKLNLIV